jgi:hypothetical protein
VADGGGARPESAREKGPLVAEGAGLGAGSSGEARALERGCQRGVETRGRVGAVALERRGRRRGREGKKREGGSGHRSATWRGTASWGLAPTVSRPAATRMRRARAAHRCSDNDALAPTGCALVAARAERRGWRAGVLGPAREESGVAEPR